MEEELNENELEERFYSALYYGDEGQNNVVASHDTGNALENVPRSTVRRYWRTSGDRDTPHTHGPINNPYQKINVPQEPTALKTVPDQAKAKEEKPESPPDSLPAHLSMFKSGTPQNVKKTIVFIDSSDEDEVIEVALPPKPTITIESSDDEIIVNNSPVKTDPKPAAREKNSNAEREKSTSPVPSVVSSVSDEFIRGDCIALNISSRRPDNHSFDFSLHGSDLLVQNTPSKKRKKKKSKENVTSTPIAAQTPDKPVAASDGCFATPKSKAKNKKQRKSYVVNEKSVPYTDVYDSDSNHSVIDITKKNSSYIVTEKSFPSADVYESDSNTSETVKESSKQRPTQPNNNIESSDSSISVDQLENNTTNTLRSESCNDKDVSIIDLTDNNPCDSVEIHENIVMGNVTGFTECEDYNDKTLPKENVSKFGSTKIPAILYENLDFDNLKGKEKVCKNRRYSLTTLRAEMEKFYNESWGGEDFNHREIQKNMSRDKSLWVIDPKDRMPSMSKRKISCNYCNRPGHRDDTCRLKPPVCYMCGTAGHVEPRCPSKICVNCGSPNFVYSSMCRNCASWARMACAECGQLGHPASHCPDTWRRYHNTIDITAQLEENHFTKKHNQMFCSGCTRRGHLVHTCRVSLPFSGLPINSPYVRLYRPLYTAPIEEHPNRNKQYNFTPDSTSIRNKRQSKSPTVHETHVNKKKNVSVPVTDSMNTKSPVPSARKLSQSKEPEDSADVTQPTGKKNSISEDTGKAPDFIPLCSTNHDRKGYLIQDNEVSDTSDAVTTARIYVTNEIIDKLKTEEGGGWLKETAEKNGVDVQNTDIQSFLSIRGKLADQEAFQLALRDWAKSKTSDETTVQEAEEDEQEPDYNQFFSDNIPKGRNTVLRKLTLALNSLEKDLGEPNSLYKELNYFQNRHQELLKQKVINPKQLSNNRNNINKMLKKLNMVLLGQAGLANGDRHLSGLYNLQEKLKSLRQKKISNQLREEIGQHYHFIFNSSPRDDYGELLHSFNRKKGPLMQNFRKKNNDKSFVVNPKKKKFNTIPTQQKNRNFGKEVTTGELQGNSPHVRNPFAERTKNKLVFYHRRLLNTRPNDAVLKKTRMELVRKLHSQIASLANNGNTSSKALKKIRKIQEQAQLFLNRV